MPEALNKKVIDLTEEYLGPAAERFINRQIMFHLKKNPDQLTKSDIPKLAEWVKVSLALLTEDKKMVDDFNIKISGLAK